MTNWSDKPVIVDGISVDPRMPISPQRRREIAETVRAASRSDRTPDDVERDYLAWRRERFAGACDHGDTMGPLGCRRCGMLREESGC